MKRRILHLTVAFLTCTIGLVADGISSRYWDYTQSSGLTINIDNTSELGAKLDVTQYDIAPTTWKASITLTDTGSKVITGYEIENIESYEFKKDVWFSLGGNGIRLEPGQTTTFPLGSGFPSSYSYGKNVGRLQENTFRIRHLEFDDGSVADNKNRKLLPQD